MKRTLHISKAADDILRSMYIRQLENDTKRTLSGLVSDAIIHYKTHMDRVVFKQLDEMERIVKDGWIKK